MSNKENSFKMLEEGELSDSSIEVSSIHLSDQTVDCIPNYSSNCSSNCSTNLSSNFSIYQSKYLSDQSLIDSERSLIEMFSMDVSQDSDLTINKPKKAFTGWTQQLIEEQSRQKCQTDIAAKLAERKRAYEESMKKREQMKLENFSNDISRCLREKRNDLVYKIVEACGYHKSSELCSEAQEIYSTTGMQTAEGRNRTLGGCFFQLVKSKGGLSDAKKREIFYEPTAMLPQRIKKIKQAKKQIKQQQKNQQKNIQLSKLEQIKNQLADMNLNINVRLK